MPPTATLAPDVAARLLKEVVESPRALAALDKHGLKTLGDVARVGVGSLHTLAGVGEATVSLLEKAIGPVEVEEDPQDAEVEEGPHPLRMDSPYREFRMCVVPAGRVEQPGGGYALQESIFIEFAAGEGALSKEQYLMRALARNRSAVAAAMKDPAYPWRRDAARWLRSKDSFARGEFRILKD